MVSASCASKNHVVKSRKRVDAGPPAADSTQSSALKRGSNGSAFVRCESCSKDVPAATMDMHDCKQDQKTKTVLDKVPVDASATRGPLKEKNAAMAEKAKRKVDAKEPKKPKKAARVKDSNQPKRPPTAFFLFMEEFRKTFKESNPESKGVSEVAKSGGEKWKAMSDEEKGPFVRRAASLKEQYQIALKAFIASKKSGSELDMEEKCGENEDPTVDNNES